MAKVNDLDKLVMDELDDFAGACITDIQEAAAEAGKWAVKQLKATSPEKTGAFAKSWKMKKEKTRLGTNTIIYNDKKYYHTHILEYGHPLPQGGRTAGKAFIAPVEAQANQKFAEALARRIENGA